MSISTRIIDWASDQISVLSGHSNLGIARSILALGTLLTLLSNDENWLFVNQIGTKLSIKKSYLSIFYIAGDKYVDIARIICILILIIVLIGVYPRYTSLLHWWVSYSIFSSVQLLDGGDQITNILTLLLIPIYILNPNKTHWNSVFPDSFDQKILIYFFLALARFQMCVLYFEAATAKFTVAEWKDGTAVYYFLNNRAFGSTETITNFLITLSSYSFFVVLLTWGTIIIELLLAAAFFMNRKYWLFFFWMGVLFHIMIYLMLGLSSFSLAMIAGLIIYLKPSNLTNRQISLAHG